VTNVLFITLDRPLASALNEVADELHEHYGATVRLATFVDPEQIGEVSNLDEIHRVQLHLSHVRGKVARKYTPSWAYVVVRNPLLRKKLQKADNILKPWLLARTDPWLMKHAREADVLVALDARAVYTVWELAQINTKAKAVRGLYESLEALKRPDEHVADIGELASHGPGTGATER
jgi:hypothetical protein